MRYTYGVAASRELTVDDRNAWERELGDALALLLGRPLAEYPVTSEYAFYAWNDEISVLALEDHLSADVDLEAIARGDSIDGDSIDGDGDPVGDNHFSWDVWPVDHARSVWLIDQSTVSDDGPLGGDLGAALAAASTRHDSEYAVSGADLARVLLAHQEQADEVDSDELIGSVQWLARIRTDGTLLGAMRAATWTFGGRDELVPFTRSAKVEPKWDEVLRQVPDARLRDHLRMLCLTAHWARSDGAYYLGPGDCPFDLRWVSEQPGYDAVAGWEFGEGQASSAVFAIK